MSTDMTTFSLYDIEIIKKKITYFNAFNFSSIQRNIESLHVNYQNVWRRMDIQLLQNLSVCIAATAHLQNISLKSIYLTILNTIQILPSIDVILPLR